MHFQLLFLLLKDILRIFKTFPMSVYEPNICTITAVYQLESKGQSCGFTYNIDSMYRMLLKHTYRLTVDNKRPLGASLSNVGPLHLTKQHCMCVSKLFLSP